MTFTEVIKVEEGKFCHLSAHVKRMVETTRHFFGSAIDVSPLTEDALPAPLRKGVVKCRVVYAGQMIAVEFQRYTLRTIHTLALVEDNEVEYRFKYQNRDHLDRLMAQRGDADDVLIVQNGLITDTSFSNVVFQDSCNDLFTPDSYLLAGTKRQQLLERGHIRERRISVDDLSHYTGLYLINTMVDLRHIPMIDIALVGNGVVGRKVRWSL